MKSKLVVSAVLLFASGIANAIPITYSVFDDLVGATISGSITTDGTIGTIGNANITDWSLFLDDGVNTSTLNSANSFLHSANSSTNFTATVNDLIFDHSFGYFFLFFANDNIAFWCLEGPNDGCSSNPSTSNIAINNSGQRITYIRPDSGLQIVGTTGTTTNVAEPSILALMSVGLIGLIGVARKKRV